MEIYALHQQVLADWSASDALSGIAAAAGTAANGSPIDTSSAGAKSFTVTATNQAGNSASQTVHYTVVGADGFHSITSNFNGTAIPAGSTVWFSGALKVSGVTSTPVTVHVAGQTIAFDVSGVSHSLAVPNAHLAFANRGPGEHLRPGRQPG